MKKAASLVDKALEVARRERGVPHKPVRTKGKKTVPAALDWGPGIPLDKLAYLNDDEMALIQAKRMFKGKRKYKGVPAFPDPGDTAAGDTGQGTTSSGGLNDGGGSTYGGGGGSDSGAGGAGGMGGNYGGDTGGSSDSGNVSGGIGGDTGGSSDSGNAASSSSSSAAGTSSTSGASDQSRSSGPSSGPTSQPVRTETSYSGPTTTPASSSFSSFGSPSSSYNPVTSAPSSMATEAALDRIASGSSVIGNTTPGGYSVPKIQDRVPSSVTYTPPTSTPPVDTTGANSPFADPEVGQYDADRPSLAGAVSQYSQYRSPPSPTTSAYTNAQNQMYTAEDAANFGEDGALPRGGGYARVMDPTPTSYDPTPSQYTQSDMAGTTRAYGDLAGPNQGLGYSPTAPGTYAGNTAVASAQTPAAQDTTGLGAAKTITDRVPATEYEKAITDRVPVAPGAYAGNTAVVSAQAPTVSLSNLADPNLQQAADYSFAQNNRWKGLSGYGTLNTPEETAMAQPTAYAGAAPVSQAATDSVVGAAPVSSPAYANKNVFYSSPAEQAADIRRAVALAQGPATAPTEITIPGGDIPAGVTPASSDTGVVTGASTGEYDYDPAQDPADYMSPIYPGDEDQPGYLSAEQRAAYLRNLGDTRSSEFMTPIGREQDVQQVAKPSEEETTKPEKPDKPNKPNKGLGRLKRNYMYTNYRNKNVRPDRDIVAFNDFNKRFFEKGGRVGDSVEAALRIAKSKLL